MRELFLPLGFALILTVILTPVVGAFERVARLPRFASVALAMLLAISSVSVVGWIVSAQILQTAEKLPAYRQNGASSAKPQPQCRSTSRSWRI